MNRCSNVHSDTICTVISSTYLASLSQKAKEPSEPAVANVLFGVKYISFTLWWGYDTHSALGKRRTATNSAVQVSCTCRYRMPLSYLLSYACRINVFIHARGVRESHRTRRYDTLHSYFCGQTVPVAFKYEVAVILRCSGSYRVVNEKNNERLVMNGIIQ